jgi:hypothetical protein
MDFDDHRRDLGRTTASGAIKDQISGYEGGAKSAQPAWDDFMKSVLEGVPEEPLTPPPGIVTVNIDRSTGQLASGGNSASTLLRAPSPPSRRFMKWAPPLPMAGKPTNCSDKKAPAGAFFCRYRATAGAFYRNGAAASLSRRYSRPEPAAIRAAGTAR